MPAETTPGGHHRFSPADVDVLAEGLSPRLRLNSKLISSGAAALLLGVSQHTVIRACREGRMEPDETTPGGHRRFSETRIRELAPAVGELLSTGGAARALGLTAGKIRRAVQLGTLTPAAITPGGHRRFAAADLSSPLREAIKKAILLAPGAQGRELGRPLVSNGNGNPRRNGNGAAHGTA